MIYHRDVAQLVAHYVRDVGVGRSSRLIPTKVGKCKISLFDFFVYQFVEIGISYRSKMAMKPRKITVQL